jgi:hypothetical protein
MELHDGQGILNYGISTCRVWWYLEYFRSLKLVDPRTLLTWVLSTWARRLYPDCVIWLVYYQEYSFMTWYNWLSVGDYLSYQRIHHHNHHTIDQEDHILPPVPHEGAENTADGT